MSRNLIAEHIVDEWKMVNGFTVAGILQEYFDGRMRVCKTASERNELIEARALAAGATTDFVKGIAEAVGASIGSVMAFLKNSAVVRFFSAIGWSLENLWDELKDGHRVYRDLRKKVSEYMADTGVGRWTTDELRKLDEYIKDHPIAMKVTGVALGGLLVFLWFNEAFTGDAEYDFDISEVVEALEGKFSFADIFGGPAGAHRLVALAVGSVLSFPWPGPSSVYFVGAMIAAIAKKTGFRFRRDPIRDVEL